jgi:hypothetical protein
MKRITWFKCREVQGRLYAPFVTATLEFGDKKSRRIDFLIDSGASRSMVPRYYVADLFELHEAPAEVESELRDAGGRALKGLDIDFNVAIAGAGGLPATHERLLMGRDIKWAVLGMTWFEKVGVHFRSFPRAPSGRQFALYPCPCPEEGTLVEARPSEAPTRR